MAQLGVGVQIIVLLSIAAAVHAPGPLVTSLLPPFSGLLLSIAGLVFKSPIFYFIMAPKHKSRDAGNSDVPERSRKVRPCRE